MEYIVSARKYRPMSFDSVVGQSALTTTLKNAVKSGKLAHAYLFCGPRGVGKTTCARIFAKAINCQNPTEDGEACNCCESCQSFNEQRSFNIFELDAASNNSVENIKTLMEQTRIPPQVGRYKVFIIDEVHMLSTAAFNAFLKTLEEPPAHVIFILATTEKHKILPTILSRCQIYDFERMTVANTINHLKRVAEKEGVAYEEQALELIAEKADGGMRDALSIFDQAASFCQGNITYQKVIEDLNVLDSENYFKIIDNALENKVSDTMLLLNGILGKGFDGGNLINGLSGHVRNLLMAKDPVTIPLLECSQQQARKYQQQAQKCPTPFLYRALKIMNQCDVNYKQSSSKRLLVELTLIQVAQITQADDKDVPVAGRSPKRLKSLFSPISNSQPHQAMQVAEVEKKEDTPLSTNQPSLSNPSKTEETVDSPATPANSSVPPPLKPQEESAGGTLSSPKFKLGSIGFTFNDIRRGPEKPAYQKEPEVKDHKAASQFTQEDLELQWMSMCNRMPQQMVGMASRLKNVVPKITNYPAIEVIFDNQILLNQVENIKGRIRVTLANSLHNAALTLDFRLAEAEEFTKMLSKREVFDEIRKANPAIEKLRSLLDLEMA